MVRAKNLVWVVFVSMFLANLSIFILGYIETKTVINLLKVPFRVLAPAIMILSTIGAFALRNSLLDVWVMFITGIAGYLLRRSGYSMPGIILGVILGHLGESAFVKSMQMLNYNWLGFFVRPVSAILLCIALVILFFNLLRPTKELIRTIVGRKN
jgi:putative tricarboxylic transport membrane protein